MRLEDVRDGMLVQVVRPSPSVKQFTGLVGVVARVNLKWMHPVLVRFSDGTEQHFGEDELELVEGEESSEPPKPSVANVRVSAPLLLIMAIVKECGGTVRIRPATLVGIGRNEVLIQEHDPRTGDVIFRVKEAEKVSWDEFEKAEEDFIIKELEKIAAEGARELEESGYTYERAVEDTLNYIHEIREQRLRERGKMEAISVEEGSQNVGASKA